MIDVDMNSKYWRDIPGYEGRYKISRDGEIMSMAGRWGKPHLVKAYRSKRKRATSRPYIVHLTSLDGKEHTAGVLQLMVKVWIGEKPAGMVAYHKDGNLGNNALYNIGFITRKELGRMSGSKTVNTRPVAMIDPYGEVVAWYDSARKAGKANHMSYQTVLDRLNNKVKNPFELTGYSFTWEPENYRSDDHVRKYKPRKRKKAAADLQKLPE